MSTKQEPVTVLSEPECWDLSSNSNLGRLVTLVDGRMEIFPVNFVVQGRTLLFRTGEGTKLFSTVVNSQVLFEVDDRDAIDGWSVIVRGTARPLWTTAEIAEADRAPLFPSIATHKPHYVRIEPNEITGRRFTFGPDERVPW